MRLAQFIYWFFSDSGLLLDFKKNKKKYNIINNKEHLELEKKTTIIDKVGIYYDQIWK